MVRIRNREEAGTGATGASLPETADFIDAAIEISRVLRMAKVEAPLRPKVVGAVVLALYQGDIAASCETSLAAINELVEQAVAGAKEVSSAVKTQLMAALHLSEADFPGLAPYMSRAVAILKRLNIRAALRTDADFLGMFYEAFLRYGYDNNALGIVFTPRHITSMCVSLTAVEPRDRVIDIACGTGGFLVAAFDAMVHKARGDAVAEKVKDSFAGFDTNPTVWALALLNLFFRGDGKSHIFNADCFDENAFSRVRGRYTRAYLNPPFSQADEPERRFIDRAMEALEPDGIAAVVVKAGVFADDEHKAWRQQFLHHHRLLAVISLPEDLFYPNASAPTSIMLAQAHVPLAGTDEVFLGRVWYDGFQKLKKRRVAGGPNQVPEMVAAYHQFLRGDPVTSPLATLVTGQQLQHGAEWSPQEWLPQPVAVTERELQEGQQSVTRSIFQAVSAMPDLATVVLADFAAQWQALPPLPLNMEDTLDTFFSVLNGKSRGEKQYIDGDYPYISSGDQHNSIIRLVEAEAEECFACGGITVTAFGLASVQPWPFVARGNGGSSVRVLTPRYRMSFRELVWFAAQINVQRWRFFYARMAILGRLARLKVRTPPAPLPDAGLSIAERATVCRQTLDGLSRLDPAPAQT